MTSTEVIIQNAVGLHARPAALLVQTAQQFTAKITVTYEDKSANAKSLLGLLSLGASRGANLLIAADGEDEKEAISSLYHLITTNFGE